MSITGTPQYVSRRKRKTVSAKIAIIAASWHETAMNGLIQGATRALLEAHATTYLYRVPGSFELSVVASQLLARKDIDGVVALGVVVRGGTPHFDYVCQAATQGLTQASVHYRKPVGFGVLTCDNESQALARAGLEDSLEDKGYEAASAVIDVLQLKGKRIKKISALDKLLKRRS